MLVCLVFRSFLALRLVEILNLRNIKGNIISALIVLPDSELQKEKARTVYVTGFPDKLNTDDLLQWIYSIQNVERYWLEVNKTGNCLSLVMDSVQSCDDLIELISSFPFGNYILNASKKAVYNCCIKGIPTSWKEKKLRQYCRTFGTIKGCVMMNIGTSLIAFVEFSTAKECKNAISCSNDEKKVEFEGEMDGRIRRN